MNGLCEQAKKDARETCELAHTLECAPHVVGDVEEVRYFDKKHCSASSDSNYLWCQCDAIAECGFTRTSWQ